MPAVVGVPLNIRVAGLKVSPGTEPAATDQAIGAVPPLATSGSVWLYAHPDSAPATGCPASVILEGLGGFTTTEKFARRGRRAVSVDLNDERKVPAGLRGSTRNTPVVASSVSPPALPR